MSVTWVYLHGKQGISISGSHVDKTVGCWNSMLPAQMSWFMYVHGCRCLSVKDCVCVRGKTLIKIICVCSELVETLNEIE